MINGRERFKFSAGQKEEANYPRGRGVELQLAGHRRNNCRVHEKGLLVAGQTAKITKVIKFQNFYAQKG